MFTYHVSTYINANYRTLVLAVSVAFSVFPLILSRKCRYSATAAPL